MKDHLEFQLQRKYQIIVQFEEPEITDANQSSKKQIPSEENVVEGYCEVLTAKEIEHYICGEKVEETKVNDTSADELKTEEDTRGKVEEISVSTNDAREITKFDKTATTDATQRLKEQMPRADKVFKGPHLHSIMVEIVKYSPAEEEKKERFIMDTTTKSELQEQADKLPSRKTETKVTTKEKVQIPEVQSSKYDNGVKGCNDQEKIYKYDSEVTAAASSEVLGEYLVSEAKPVKPVCEKIGDCPKSGDVAKEDTDEVKSHKDDKPTQYSPSESLYEITNATGGLNMEKQEGRIDKAVTLLLPGTSGDEECNELDKEEQYPLITQKESTEEVNSSIKDEEKEEKTEGQESVATSVTKLDADENLTKRENEDKEFHNQSTNSDLPFAGQKSAREFRGEIKELIGADDSNVVTSNVGGESGRERKTSNKCEDILSSMKSDLIPEKKVMERPTEERLDGDENLTKSENEDKKFHNQSTNSDLPFAGQKSAREFQGEIKELLGANDSNAVTSNVGGESGRERKTSDKCEDILSSMSSDLIPEKKATERSTEEILTKAEHREDKDQGDKIAQKDGLPDLAQVTNNSENTDMPCKSSIIMSDLIMAKENPETCIERKLLREDECPRGEALQPETEELKTGDDSQAVAEAVKAVYGDKEQLKDVCNEEIEKFTSAILEQNSPNMQEQSRQETPQAQDDREAEDQQKTINESRLEIARKEEPLGPMAEMDTNLLLNMQKHEVGLCCQFDEQVLKADPNDSSIDNKNLPEVQEKEIAESFCAGGEAQEAVTCSEDKETGRVTGRSILYEKTTTSLPNLLEVSTNEKSQAPGDFNSESKRPIQKEEMKDGTTGTSEPEEPNTDEDKYEEGQGGKQQSAELGYDHSVILEAPRHINVKAFPKKSHNILSGVGSKVKHSIAKVKKVITGKSSHPKPSSPK